MENQPKATPEEIKKWREENADVLKIQNKDKEFADIHGVAEVLEEDGIKKVDKMEEFQEQRKEN
jgi:hypothetical protein